MGSADVTQALGKSGDGQAKRECHLDLLIWFVIVAVPTAAVMLRKMKRVIPTSSAKTALQNALLFSSFMTGISGHTDVLVWGFLRALSKFLCQKRVFIG